jgi:hypothetical protein
MAASGSRVAFACALAVPLSVARGADDGSAAGSDNGCALSNGGAASFSRTAARRADGRVGRAVWLAASPVDADRLRCWTTGPEDAWRAPADAFAFPINASIRHETRRER